MLWQLNAKMVCEYCGSRYLGGVWCSCFRSVFVSSACDRGTIWMTLSSTSTSSSSRQKPAIRRRSFTRQASRTWLRRRLGVVIAHSIQYSTAPVWPDSNGHRSSTTSCVRRHSRHMPAILSRIVALRQRVAFDRATPNHQFLLVRLVSMWRFVYMTLLLLLNDNLGLDNVIIEWSSVVDSSMLL